MLNEQKIKEEYQLALLDQKESKSIENNRVFYRSDYISKELLKSFFSGTLAFVGIALLWLLSDMDALTGKISSIDYESFAMKIILIYLAFMAIYFIITYLVYIFRYEKQALKAKSYRNHLKRLNKIYSQEEK